MCKYFDNFFFLVVLAYMVSIVRYSQSVKTFINTNTFTLVIYLLFQFLSARLLVTKVGKLLNCANFLIIYF